MVQNLVNAFFEFIGENTLKNYITREFLKAVVIPFAIVELLLLAVYFLTNIYINTKTKETLIQSVQYDLKELSKYVSVSFDARLSKVEQLTMIMQKEHERFFANPDSFVLTEEPTFDTAPNGIYYQTSRGETSLYYSAITPITQKEAKKARQSAALDPLYVTLKNADPLVAAVYINTFDSMNRYHPFIDDVTKQYEPAMDIPSFNFYYEADAKHNPERKIVWTDVYLDPAGLGWMASSLAPVYNGDFLEGVVGIDIVLDAFIKEIHNLKLPWEASALLIDKEGYIIAMQSETEGTLGIKEHRIENYTGVTSDTVKPMELNLKENPNKAIKASFEPLFSGSELYTTNIFGKEYIVVNRDIPSTKWKLAVLIDTDELYRPINNLAGIAQKIGYAAIGFMVLFYIIFLSYLVRHSKLIASRVSTPIEELAHNATQMRDKLEVIEAKKSEIREVDKLIDDFAQMTLHLKDLYETMQHQIDEQLRRIREKDIEILEKSREVAIGDLLKNIAHHWRQPLNLISLASEEISVAYELGELTKEELEKLIKQIQVTTLRLSSTIDEFRNFFATTGIATHFELKNAINLAVSTIFPLVESKGISLELRNNTDSTIFGCEGELIRVIVELIKNASEAFDGIDTSSRHICVESIDEAGVAVILVEDSAGGVKPEVVDKLFEPYISTKSVASGTGLGLYMVKTVIEHRFGGEVYYEPIEGGSRFVLRLTKQGSVG